jgi:tetratricopeptide (TPR) repeat protein
VARHKTTILKNARAEDLTLIFAAQRYYTYAQEQLSATASQEMIGSMALYGLGKVALTSPSSNKPSQLECTARAMSLYQAALMAQPNNFRAANELGVVMAQTGQLERARDMLVRSVTLSPQPTAWKNLAVVYFRLGDRLQAERAQSQALALERAGQNTTGPAVQWVDASTFARLAPAGDGLMPLASATPPVTQRSTQPAADSVKPAPVVAKKGISDWLPWNSRR